MTVEITNHARTRTLHVADEDADDGSEDEVLQEGRDEGERHAEDGQQQVGHAEVHQQDVGQRPHPAVLRDRQRHQRVAAQRQHEYGDVQRYAQLHLHSASASGAARRRIRRPVPLRQISGRRRVNDVRHFPAKRV